MGLGGWFGRRFGRGRGTTAAQPPPGLPPPGCEVWDDLRLLLGLAGRNVGLSDQEKIDLLLQMVANLVDEVEILKNHARQESRASFQERYRKDRMWLLYSSAGSPGASVAKYGPYLRSREETAGRLIPDPAERAAVIGSFGCLT